MQKDAAERRRLSSAQIHHKAHIHVYLTLRIKRMAVVNMPLGRGRARGAV